MDRNQKICSGCKPQNTKIKHCLKCNIVIPNRRKYCADCYKIISSEQKKNYTIVNKIAIDEKRKKNYHKLKTTKTGVLIDIKDIIIKLREVQTTRDKKWLYNLIAQSFELYETKKEYSMTYLFQQISQTLNVYYKQHYENYYSNIYQIKSNEQKEQIFKRQNKKAKTNPVHKTRFQFTQELYRLYKEGQLNETNIEKAKQVLFERNGVNSFYLSANKLYENASSFRYSEIGGIKDV